VQPLAIQQQHQRRIGLGLERLGLLPLRFPILFLLLIAGITVLSVIGYNRLKVEDSLTELFRTGAPEFKTYERLSERFPSSEFDVLVVIEGEELLTRPALQTLRDLVLELQFIEAQRGTISLFSARQPPAEGKIPPPLFPAELPTGEAFDDLIEKVRDNEILREKLLSPDGTLTLIVIALEREAVRTQGLQEVIGEIERIVDEKLRGTGLTAQLSGAPVMQLEIRNAVERDRMIYNGLGFAIGALIALVFFRRLSLVVIAAGPPALAILWSLGALGWMDFRLNLFLNVMSPLIMVMAFSDTMQITFAMRDRLVAGDDKRTALRYAILRVGPACVLTVATAAASFITLLISDSALIRTFGAAGALSTAIAYVAVITLVPLLGMLLLGNHDRHAGKPVGNSDMPMKALRSLCEWIADRVTARPIVYASLGIVLIITMGAAHLSLEPRYQLADQVPDREQALEASGRLDEKLTGANPVHILIEFEQGQDVFDPRSLEVIAKVHRLVERQPGIGNVWSVETLRDWLQRSNDYSIEKLKQYVDILPAHLVRRFLAEDGRSVVVTGRVPDVDASDLLPIIDAIDGNLDDIRQQYPGFEIRLRDLGHGAAGDRRTQQRRHDQPAQSRTDGGDGVRRADDRACLPFHHHRGGRRAAWPVPDLRLGHAPRHFGGGAAIRQYRGANRRLRSGAGRDHPLSQPSAAGGPHYLNRLQQEDRPGADPVEVIKRATVLIGPALMLTTIVLACGLAVAMFSDLPSLRLFGRLAAITLVAALIGDLMILPSVMLLIRRMRRRSAQAADQTASGP